MLLVKRVRYGVGKMSNIIKGSKIKGNNFKKEVISKLDNVKIRRSKVRRKSDKELEKEAIVEENMSILVIVLIVLICFVVGISLGIGLYKLAINSSSAVIINKLLLRN